MKKLILLLATVGILLAQRGTIMPPNLQNVNGGTPQQGVITLAKVASPTSGLSTVGSITTYTYTITNPGSVPVSAPFTVSDNKQGTFGCGITSGTLTQNQTTSCTSTHATTQADLDAGSLQNTASASNGGGITSNTVQATVTFSQLPAISLVKAASPTSFNTSNTVITYTYTVTNTGNVTLANAVGISDKVLGVVFGTINSCGTLAMSPGGQQTCSLPYTTTATDVTNGQVVNNATATTTFGGNNVTATASLTVPAGIDITNPPGGHGLTAAVCDNSTDDSAAIQGTLNYAYSLAVMTNPPHVVTVTGPSNHTCKTQVWHSQADNGGQQSSVIDLPSYVNFQGTGALGTSTPLTLNCAGGSPPTANPTCINIGVYVVSWELGRPTTYAVNNTTAGTSAIQLTTGPFPSLSVGDYVGIYPMDPTCNGCDVIPAEVWQIKTYNSGTGAMTLQPAGTTGAATTLAYSFTNHSFTYTPTGGVLTNNVVSLIDFSKSCQTNPVIHSSCHVEVNPGLQNMKVLSLGQINITETIGLTLNYVTYDESQNWTDEINSLHWSTISNSTFTCSGCSSIGHFNQGEYMQRASGSNLISNNVYGSNAIPMNALSNAEAPHANTFSGNTLYLVAGSGNPNTFGSAGVNELMTQNTLNLIGSMTSGAGSIGGMGDGVDESLNGVTDPCGTHCYINNVQITFNTINNCTGVAGNGCILVAERGTILDHNTINIPSTNIYGVAFRDAGAGSANAYNTQVTNNTIHLGLGGIGVNNPANNGNFPDNWVINNNKIDNPGGSTDVAIQIGTSYVQPTGTGCSILGNTIGPAGNIASPMVGGSTGQRNAIVSDHPSCTIQSSP